MHIYLSPLLCQASTDLQFQDLEGIPKALLPGLAGKRIIDYWWQAVNMYAKILFFLLTIHKL